MNLSESPGTIILPTSEVGRFAMFTVSLAATKQPDRTHLTVMASASITENLNGALRHLRDEDEWVWILGDDHVWKPDCLIQLLEAMDDNDDIDVIVPLVTTRNPPWVLVVYREAGTFDDGLPRWETLQWDEIPASGVFEVEGAGNAGMVIRRQVLDAIGDPWFRSSGGVILNEDVVFCQTARAHGFRVFASADVTMGHIGIFNVRPVRRGGRWGALTEFSTPEEQLRHIFMPDVEDIPAATVVANGR